MLEQARGCLASIMSPGEEGGPQCQSQALALLEDDTYFSSSDKLVFLMRELKADFHPDRIATWANPLLVAKLAPAEVAKFDFPRLKASDIPGGSKLSDEELTERMITLAKGEVTRKYGEEATKAEAGAGGKVRGPEEEENRQVQSPSLMQMACNTVEAHRLRSDLIALVHETDVLSAVY